MRKLLILIFISAATFGQANFYLKDGDTVVFYGDSITDQRFYTTFVETYALTRFPERNIRFVHSGWGGDRVAGGGGGPIDVRLKRDVFPYKPTVLTIMLGMNDGRYRAMDQPIFDTYAAGMRNIVREVRARFPETRITLIEPSPYDDTTRQPLFEGGYNAVLVRYGQYLRQLSKDERTDVADMNSPVVNDLNRANLSDAEAAKKLIPDRVHPGPAGHLLMAKALLKAWGAPAQVTSVEIDAPSGRVVRAENTGVTDLKTESGLSWTQMDRALPMPFDAKDAGTMLAIKSSDFERALDEQPLKVTGLTAARYKLMIDGEPTGAFTREDLAGGINLAMLPTPMMKQALDVHAWTLKRVAMHQTRWRQIQVPLENDYFSHKDQAMAALDALEGDLIEMQHWTAKPKARHYELRPLEP